MMMIFALPTSADPGSARGADGRNTEPGLTRMNDRNFTPAALAARRLTG